MLGFLTCIYLDTYRIIMEIKLKCLMYAAIAKVKVWDSEK